MSGLHETRRRMVPGADTAVLFLHGIIGTPRHFDCVLKMVQVVPEEWSYVNLLLPGHGSDCNTFANSTMAQWRDAVEQCLNELAVSHRHVVLVGHSMGCLLALELAINFPKRIAGLFLLSVPLCPFVRLSAIGPCIRLCAGKVRPDHPAEVAMSNACSICLSKNPLTYLRWVPNYWQLLRLAGKVRRDLHRLQTDCIAFQSRHDELVSNRSTVLLRRCSSVQVHELPESFHYRYSDADGSAVMDCFCRLIDAVSEMN